MALMIRVDTTRNKNRKMHTFLHLLHYIYLLQILLETIVRSITRVVSDSRTRQIDNLGVDDRYIFKSCLFSSCASIR